jgi:HEPN domain-containing protein
LRDLVCFHCQQAAEKYLKALLEESGAAIPKSHDLEMLLLLLLPHHPSLKSHRRAMRSLSEFAVATRYPGDNANKRQMAASMRWADNIRQACRSVLGMRARER